MSANNWRICPKCKAKAAATTADLLKKAEAAYGKVPAAKYAEMVKVATAEPELEETLREDWQLGTDDEGTFEVSYSCSCQRCDFRHQFKHSEDVLS